MHEELFIVVKHIRDCSTVRNNGALCNVTLKNRINLQLLAISSVAEPPLFWAAPAPEVQGPGANSGSDQIGSAPAPGEKKAAPEEKRRFQAKKGGSGSMQ